MNGRTPLFVALRGATPRHTTCGRSTLTVGHAECWTVRSTKAEENVVSPPWLPTLGDRTSSPSCAWNLAKKRSPHSKKKRNVAGRVRSLWDYGWNFHFSFLSSTAAIKVIVVASSAQGRGTLDALSSSLLAVGFAPMCGFSTAHMTTTSYRQEQGFRCWEKILQRNSNVVIQTSQDVEMTIPWMIC